MRAKSTTTTLRRRDANVSWAFFFKISGSFDFRLFVGDSGGITTTITIIIIINECINRGNVVCSL